MKNIGFGSFALVMSIVPAMAGAQSAPQSVTSQAVRQGATPSPNMIEDAAKAAAAAANGQQPAQAGHVHAAPAASPSSNTVITTVTTTPANPGPVQFVQTQGGDRPLIYDYRNAERGDVTYQGRWTGTWTGHYEGQPAQVYQGAYDGRYDGSAPRKRRHDGPDRVYYAWPGYGYSYGWAPPVITTITYQSAPVVTTTTTTTEEIIYGAAPRKRIARRSWKPRPKQRCAC